VGYTLSLHHQQETEKVDKELRAMTQNLYLATEEMKNLTEDMKGLTQDTVDDSATVRTITFVSAIYLPGSFAAVGLPFLQKLPLTCIQECLRYEFLRL
jgi:hypothetical protein